MSEIITNGANMPPDEENNRMLREILVEPAETCDELRIVSGYVSSSMVKRHIEILDRLEENLKKTIEIKIIVGMIPKDGMSIIEHNAFKNLVKERKNLVCSYMMTKHPACHSKIYVWYSNGVPVLAYNGSANYSQNAFFGDQIESMSKCDPNSASSFFDSLIKDTAYCNLDEIEDMVMIVSEKEFTRRIKHIEQSPSFGSNNVVRLSLLSTRTKEMGETSSLNWGQRDRREPNQAYIPIPREIAKKRFFPDKKTIFTVMTDDGMIFQCVTAQNKKSDPLPKAIESCNNNSELGIYFRNRLGVPLGTKVEKSDLERYGRTDVTFVDLQDGTYYMDFGKPRNTSFRLDPEY